MSQKRRWWARKPGRWYAPLEEALASGTPSAIGLAWAIILTTGGEGRGAPAEFSRLTGVAENAISDGLKGKSFGAKQRERVFRRFPQLRDDLFERGTHPFSIEAGQLRVVLEPGDRNWGGHWSLLASSPEDTDPVEELRRQHPKLFPEWAPRSS